VNRTPIAKETRARIDKWGCIKKAYAHQKKLLQKCRHSPQNGEKKSLQAIHKIKD
jgi:hypothetical protein